MRKNKIEFVLFCVLLFLQNFALLKTNEFGFNGFFIFLLIITIFNAKYYFKFTKKEIVLYIIIIGILLFGSFFNSVFYYTQILRVLMQLFIIRMTYMYMKKVYNDGNDSLFYNIYIKILLVFLLYGVYEFIAIRSNLPLFLNIFSNNPSYTIRDIYSYFSGWNNKYRLYNVFFEPSIFSIFIAYNFYFVMIYKKISKKTKIFLSFLMLFNLYFSYARTGYLVFAYMMIIFVLFKILKNKSKYLAPLILLLPFLNLYVMYLYGLNTFTDLSSYTRTYSGLYYFNNSFDNLKHILIGHGCGSIVNHPKYLINYIDSSSHNGYVDILYLYGLPVLLVVVSFFKKIFNISKNNKWFVLGLLSTFLCFENYYTVETIVGILTIFAVYCIMGDKNEEN